MRILSGTSGWSFKEWKGRFYPADLPAGPLPRLLRRAFRHRGGEQHVLPDAQESVLLELGRSGAAALSLRRQGLTAHHPLFPPQGRGGQPRLTSSASRTRSGEARGPASLPAAAQPEEGSPASRGLPRACCPPRWRATDRVPASDLAGGRCAHDALRAKDVALCMADQDDFSVPPIGDGFCGVISRLHRLDIRRGRRWREWGRR